MFGFLLMMSEAFVFIEFLTASDARRGTKKQMRDDGILHGIAFLSHGGMWGDMLIVSPMCAWMVANAHWSQTQWLVCLAIGAAASLLMHFLLYIPDGKVYPAWSTDGGDDLSIAGWIHLMYMAVALAVQLLYFFCTPSPAYVGLFTIALAVYIVLEVVQPAVYSKRPISMETVLTAAGAWTLLLLSYLWVRAA